MFSAIRVAFLDALAIIIPTSCVVCGRSDRSLCSGCVVLMNPTVTRILIGLAPNFLEVWAATSYDKSIKNGLALFKESGRTDAAKVFAATFSAALAAAEKAVSVEGSSGFVCELAVAPSSRSAFRKRGYNPAMLLARKARSGRKCTQPVHFIRSVSDQAGLTRAARYENIHHSMAASGSLSGRNFLLVDDVLTTGSTLLEFRRAVCAAGGTVHGAVCLAYTTKRSSASRVLKAG